MLIVDKMIVGGVKFVLGKVAAAVEAELNDDSHLREELLAAQMRLELGELSAEEFAAFERDILQRLREIRERQRGDAGHAHNPGDFKVTGIEASTTFDDPGE
ncbi:MAG TPA: gas vesicle protein GvpG [Myxococcales bacterium]